MDMWRPVYMQYVHRTPHTYTSHRGRKEGRKRGHWQLDPREGNHSQSPDTLQSIANLEKPVQMLLKANTTPPASFQETQEKKSFPKDSLDEVCQSEARDFDSLDYDLMAWPHKKAGFLTSLCHSDIAQDSGQSSAGLNLGLPADSCWSKDPGFYSRNNNPISCTAASTSFSSSATLPKAALHLYSAYQLSSWNLSASEDMDDTLLGIPDDFKDKPHPLFTVVLLRAPSASGHMHPCLSVRHILQAQPQVIFSEYPEYKSKCHVFVL